MRPTSALFAIALLASASPVHAQNWQPVVAAEELQRIFSDRTFERTLREDSIARAVYNADGSGHLDAWGDRFDREWRIEGDDQVCVLIEDQWNCFTIERNLDANAEFRATNVETGQSVIIRGVDGVGEIETGVASGESAPSQPSAEELAAKLANPTSPVMTIGNNFDYITYDGDLPGASDQSAVRYVFQTVFPFKLSNGGSIFFRPAIPVIFNDPLPDGMGGYSSEGTDLLDTGFDLSYGITTPSGLLWGAGLVGTIPTATNDALGQDLWALGPEVLLGAIGKWGVFGGVISHQWDFAGSGDGEIDKTGLNYFYAFPLGGGWQVAAGPSITYDHAKSSDDAWTIPAGIGLAKTTVIKGRPWKFQIQYWNYIESADAFAPEHQIRISINPVVSAPWNESK